MSPSELGFLKGLIVIVVVSMVLKFVAYLAFCFTLSDEDKEKLTNPVKTDEPVKIATHTSVLACIIFAMNLSIFFNSAMIVAMGLRSLL